MNKVQEIRNRYALPFIVKVQRAVAGEPAILVYNEDRVIQQQFPPTPELMRMFGDKFKMFCWAQLAPDGTLDIGQEAPWQNW